MTPTIVLKCAHSGHAIRYNCRSHQNDAEPEEPSAGIRRLPHTRWVMSSSSLFSETRLSFKRKV